MPLQDTHSSAAAKSVESGPTVQTRIDPPHVIADGPLPSPNESDAAAVDVVMPDDDESISETAFSEPVDLHQAAEAPEQLQLQTEQLAAHFREQQEQLDRREADLHIQEAAQETAGRSARLWLRERQQDLAERDAELTRRQQELETRQNQLAELEQAQADAAERVAAEQRQMTESLLARELDLARRENDLAARATEQHIQSATLAQSAAQQRELDDRLRAEQTRLGRQTVAIIEAVRSFLHIEGTPAESDLETVSDDLLAAIEQLRLRQLNLDEAEALLADGQTELDAAQRQFVADRAAHEERCLAERRELAELRHQAESAFEKHRQAIIARSENLERRSAAVDQLRAEALRAEREALELRLATDETWSQLAGSAPPALLTQSLARIRGKLADQYRLERAEIEQQRTELESLTKRLEEQRERVQRQKLELEQWSAERQAQIEGQATRLVAREQELDRRHTELNEVGQQQQRDRRVYEDEIRRLLALLRQGRPFERAA